MYRFRRSAPAVLCLVSSLFLCSCGVDKVYQQSVAGQTVSITGADGGLYVTHPAQLHALAVLADGSSSDVTTSALWASTSASVATVGDHGLVTCLATGTSLITATVQGGEGTSPITCSAAQLLITGFSGSLLIHDQVQLHATVTFGSNSSDVTAGAGWSSTSPEIATLSNTGVLTCDTEGTTTVSATTVAGTAARTVVCASLPSTVTIAPSSVTAGVGKLAQLSLAATRSDGTSVNVTSQAAWSSQTPSMSVSDLGVLSCNAAGAGVVTAVYLGISASITGTCTPLSMHTPSYFRENSDEFVGPFVSWMNVKTQFGAVGDGVADDTAAIQRALDFLNSPGANPVLWFPAGVYRITQELRIRHKQCFSLIGEDPATVFLKWDGASNGTILHTDGSTRYVISRLTFDGSSTANNPETMDTITTGGYYQTFVSLSDQHIIGFPYGIRLPKAAEVTVDRIHFDHLTNIAFSVEDWNTLNIFVNDSLFTHCGTGVSNLINAGSFIVSNSFFANSVVSDMSIGNTGYFTARHNTSYGSAAFFRGETIGANPAVITLQNNTILDPLNSPLYLGNMGPLMLLDNTIRFRDARTPYLVSVSDPQAPSSVFTMGNMFTSNGGIATTAGSPFAGRIISYDNSESDNRSEIPDAVVPTTVYTPPNYHRQIFEVARFTGEAIQAAIVKATNSGAVRPVIHLPNGAYLASSPITVPPESDLQLIGDDYGTTVIVYSGPPGTPALSIPSSSVTVRNLRLASANASAKADGILLSLHDQPNTQVIVDQADLQAENDVSIAFDGIEHMTAELFSTYTAGAITGVNVSGGAFRAANEGVLGTTNLYSGSMQSIGNATSFSVDRHGKFMVQDNWHDSGLSSPQNFKLTGSGTVTEQTGEVAMTSQTPFEIDGFQGDVSLIGLAFSGGFKLQSGTAATNLLNLGLVYDGPTEMPQSTGNITVGELLPSYYSQGGRDIPELSSPDVTWMRHMLAQTRAEYPIQRLPVGPSAHRIRLSRIGLDNTGTAIRLVPDTPEAGLYYNLYAGDAAVLAGSGETCLATQPSQATDPTHWLFVPLGDGSFNLAIVGSMLLLTDAASPSAGDAPVLQRATGDYSQRWLVSNVGDGRFSVANRKTGLLLGWSTGGGCLSMERQAAGGNTTWTVVAH